MKWIFEKKAFSNWTFTKFHDLSQRVLLPNWHNTKLFANKKDFFCFWYIGSQTKQLMGFLYLPKLSDCYLKRSIAQANGSSIFVGKAAPTSLGIRGSSPPPQTLMKSQFTFLILDDCKEVEVIAVLWIIWCVFVLTTNESSSQGCGTVDTCTRE